MYEMHGLKSFIIRAVLKLLDITHIKKNENPYYI